MTVKDFIKEIVELAKDSGIDCSNTEITFYSKEDNYDEWGEYDPIFTKFVFENVEFSFWCDKDKEKSECNVWLNKAEGE